MFGGFNANKLKPQLKMAVSRFQMASNKKSALMKQQIRQVALLLVEDPPKEEKAKIRAEALIRDDNLVEAYEILQLNCELLSERIKLIASQRECPADMVSCISTLIWATDRVDIPEMVEIRKQFRSKYGKKFEENAMNNVGGVLNERVVSKLSVQPPAAYYVQTYLEKIADQQQVEWKPSVKLSAEEMAEPMAAPVGYSVQVASGTGLGPAVVTGQHRIDGEINFHPKQDDHDDQNGGGGMVMPPPPLVPATPYVPSAPPAAARQDNFDEEDEVDIFIPATPNRKPGSTANGGGGGQPKNENDDESRNDGGGDDGSSYNDLAARFAALKK